VLHDVALHLGVVGFSGGALGRLDEHRQSGGNRFGAIADLSDVLLVDDDQRARRRADGARSGGDLLLRLAVGHVRRGRRVDCRQRGANRLDRLVELAQQIDLGLQHRHEPVDGRRRLAGRLGALLAMRGALRLGADGRRRFEQLVLGLDEILRQIDDALLRLAVFGRARRIARGIGQRRHNVGDVFGRLCDGARRFRRGKLRRRLLQLLSGVNNRLLMLLMRAALRRSVFEIADCDRKTGRAEFVDRVLRNFLSSFAILRESENFLSCLMSAEVGE
jgi:hypothetical protein